MVLDNNKRLLRVRIDEETYQNLDSLAKKRKENMSIVVRRILKSSVQAEEVLNAQDVLITVTRKAIAQELRQTENRLAAMSSKSAIAAASAEICILSLIQDTKGLSESRLNDVKNRARTKGVAFLRLPLKEIAEAYFEDEEN